MRGRTCTPTLPSGSCAWRPLQIISCPGAADLVRLLYLREQRRRLVVVRRVGHLHSRGARSVAGGVRSKRLAPAAAQPELPAASQPCIGKPRPAPEPPSTRLVGVQRGGQLAEGAADLLLAGGGRHAQQRIVAAVVRRRRHPGRCRCRGSRKPAGAGRPRCCVLRAAAGTGVWCGARVGGSGGGGGAYGDGGVACKDATVHPTLL